MTPTHFPLCWPATMPRASRREAGQFKATLAAALSNVEGSLRLFGRDSGKPVGSIVLSSNVTLGQNKPQDPGVAVWFVWDGQQVWVDRYASPAANLQAIHHIIKARRVELRHGTLALVRASFQGFQALPAPPGSHWTEILGLPPTASAEAVGAAYRELAKAAHPDSGGSPAAMARLNAAKAQAIKQIGAA